MVYRNCAVTHLTRHCIGGCWQTLPLIFHCCYTHPILCAGSQAYKICQNKNLVQHFVMLCL